MTSFRAPDARSPPWGQMSADTCSFPVLGLVLGGLNEARLRRGASTSGEPEIGRRVCLH